MAVYEYCLLKIASCLKAGPKAEKIYDYDIIVYKDCI